MTEWKTSDGQIFTEDKQEENTPNNKNMLFFILIFPGYSLVSNYAQRFISVCNWNLLTELRRVQVFPMYYKVRIDESLTVPMFVLCGHKSILRKGHATRKKSNKHK